MSLIRKILKDVVLSLILIILVLAFTIISWVIFTEINPAIRDENGNIQCQKMM